MIVICIVLYISLLGMALYLLKDIPKHLRWLWNKLKN